MSRELRRQHREDLREEAEEVVYRYFAPSLVVGGGERLEKTQQNKKGDISRGGE